jgi:hypothetical protein
MFQQKYYNVRTRVAFIACLRTLFCFPIVYSKLTLNMKYTRKSELCSSSSTYLRFFVFIIHDSYWRESEKEDKKHGCEA